MKAKLISTEGPYLEAVLEIEGELIHVMDEFSVDENHSPKVGEIFDFEFSNLVDEDESWESIFSGNPDRKKGIEKLSGWKYRCYGQITKISPVVVDCGLIQEEDVISTNDEKVVGDYIAFTITRLGGYPI